jgi:hypothetical protein
MNLQLTASEWEAGGDSDQWSEKAYRTGGHCLASCLLVAGCRQDMQNQPKIIPQRGSEMFADHRGARPQVVNTVARGQLHEDSYFYTGVFRARTATARSRT